MLRRAAPLFKLDGAKMLALYNVITGKQHLKDHVPVKDASLSRIFGDNYKADIISWVQSEDTKELGDAPASVELYLKRIELTRFTRNELTDFGLLARGPGAVFEEAEKCMHTLAAARLADLVQSHGAEGGKEVFRNEVFTEGKAVNWSESMCEEFVRKAVA
jgi:uncharacterized protein with von Willebrand factor type A (vWA) domain